MPHLTSNIQFLYHGKCLFRVSFMSHQSDLVCCPWTGLSVLCASAFANDIGDHTDNKPQSQS